VAIPGGTSYPMLSEAQGCVAGVSSGITYFTECEYPAPNVHEDQEGFIVLEGSGWARVGGEEQRLEPDVCFVVPAGTEHAVKRDPRQEHVKVCWFHASIHA
jgi:mannose-6-phosphate isomerase-like protein (cupin superfamily)